MIYHYRIYKDRNTLTKDYIDFDTIETNKGKIKYLAEKFIQLSNWNIDSCKIVLSYKSIDCF